MPIRCCWSCQNKPADLDGVCLCMSVTRGRKEIFWSNSSYFLLCRFFLCAVLSFLPADKITFYEYSHSNTSYEFTDDSLWKLRGDIFQAQPAEVSISNWNDCFLHNNRFHLVTHNSVASILSDITLQKVHTVLSVLHLISPHAREGWKRLHPWSNRLFYSKL